MSAKDINVSSISMLLSFFISRYVVNLVSTSKWY